MKDKILDHVFHNLNNNYEQQEDKYLTMLALVNKQKEYIISEKFDELAEVIEKRQMIIEDLEQMNIAIKPIKEEVCVILELREFSTLKIIEKVPTQGASLLHQTLINLGSLLKQIKELDAENEQLLQEKVRLVKGKLNQIQSSKQIVKAYNNKPLSNNATFFDKSR